MPRLEKMLNRLPSLYRPEESDFSLLSLFLRLIGAALEKLDRETTDVMQSHWYDYADYALYSPFFLLSRKLEDPTKPPPRPDEIDLFDHPYIQDLARLAALVPLSPWMDPPDQRERVEAFRERISDIVELYQDGLGTLDALRYMTEAQLPRDLESLVEHRDRPFSVEEFAPVVGVSKTVTARGEPLDMVGPLMFWTMRMRGVEPGMPTVYIQGLQPQADVIDATAKPVIELYQSASGMVRLGVAYNGTVPPDQTLRLRPAYSSWIGLDDGVARARAFPTADAPADPTAPGPWQKLAQAPEEKVSVIYQTEDRAILVSAGSEADGKIWRYDGFEWEVFANTPPANCLDQAGQSLWVGDSEGLWITDLYLDEQPEQGVKRDSRFNPVAALTGNAVHTIFRSADDTIWLGTQQGAMVLGTILALGSSGSSFGLTHVQGTPVYSIAEDKNGMTYFGTELGVFMFQPGLNRFYWYEGKEHSEQSVDWQPFFPDEQGEKRNFPTDNRVFLPAVKCVHRGLDASLWIGTEKGIARYLARSVRGLTYETVLEAFPDLTTGMVFAIKEDARTGIWFCTERGLFRYDGRDWWHMVSGELQHLGRASWLYSDTAKPKPRGTWRFLRSASQWQFFDGQTSTWASYTAGPRTSEQPAVRAITWTDDVSADIGKWDGLQMTETAPVDEALLLMRYKPDEERILTRGLAAVPRIPPGTSTWRYLALEPDVVPEPDERPAWTIEGRLLPPPVLPTALAEGRYDMPAPMPSNFDQAVFAFNPSARVSFTWETRLPLSVVVRLKKTSVDENIDPAIIDRVWQGIQQVRPAGVRALLAVEENIVRGK